jgi:hypothetical protein
VAVERTDVIIAGVNKAGTTSLFVSLSTHPDVAPSSIKETSYFLPPRYGEPLASASVWEGYFARQRARRPPRGGAVVLPRLGAWRRRASGGEPARARRAGGR